MAGAALRRVSLPDATLEVEVRGSGEPVVLIQTALTADEFWPLAASPSLKTTIGSSSITAAATQAAAQSAARAQSNGTPTIVNNCSPR